MALRYGVGLRDLDFSTQQQLGGSDYPTPMLAESPSGFIMTRYSMESPYYALPYEAYVQDQEVFNPFDDSTAIALQREYTAIDTDINLAAALPGIEPAERQDRFEQQPVLGLSNGREFYDTARLPKSPGNCSKTPQTEPREKLSSPFSFNGGSRSHIRSPDKQSGLPSCQLPSHLDRKDDL
jgi:hypothetical protein